jgi:16S rRNA (guanine527-N7)-methyltransferase
MERVSVDPAPPSAVEPAAQVLFRDRLTIAIRFAELLITDGVTRGLIGPREAPRIWDRHLLNCAVMATLLDDGDRVVDVGSGAGLPGIVLAIARPDLDLILVEPMARRTAFLSEVTTTLALGNVTVLRARAEELASPRSGFSPADVVTARAVAPLDRLASWCLPLVRVGGRLLAMKGESAESEIATHRDAVIRLGGSAPTVRRCGDGLIDPPTLVVEIGRERAVHRR